MKHAHDPIDALFHRVPLEKLRFQDRLVFEARRRDWVFRSAWIGGLLAAILVAAMLLIPHRDRGSFLPPDQLDAYVTSITSMTPSFADVSLKEEEE